jgi:hypothetical protein
MYACVCVCMSASQWWYTPPASDNNTPHQQPAPAEQRWVSCCCKQRIRCPAARRFLVILVLLLRDDSNRLARTVYVVTVLLLRGMAALGDHEGVGTLGPACRSPRGPLPIRHYHSAGWVGRRPRGPWYRRRLSGPLVWTRRSRSGRRRHSVRAG